jgi:UDP-3-O-acyl-N-acetylglucosamine deacetylase
MGVQNCILNKSIEHFTVLYVLECAKLTNNAENVRIHINSQEASIPDSTSLKLCNIFAAIGLKPMKSEENKWK